MSLLIKYDKPLYSLTWNDKKGDCIEVVAPTKDDSKELLEWLAQYTGMKT